jgi:predicted amidophosphoribosyltransferase
MPTKTTIQFRQHYNALLDLLLPKQCPLCRRFCFDHGLCADCWQGLAFITPPFCQCCGRPLAYAIGDHLCGSCFAKMPPLAEIRSCFLYNDPSRQLILKFKHGDALHLTPLFAHFYWHLLPPWQSQTICLCRSRLMPNNIFTGGSTNRPSWRAYFANKMKLASLPPKH